MDLHAPRRLLQEARCDRASGTRDRPLFAQGAARLPHLKAREATRPAARSEAGSSGEVGQMAAPWRHRPRRAPAGWVPAPLVGSANAAAVRGLSRPRVLAKARGRTAPEGRRLPGRGAGAQSHADPGENGDDREGRLEAFGQRDKRARMSVRGQVVVGTGDGDSGDDGNAEGGSDLEGGVAEAGGEPRFVLGIVSGRPKARSPRESGRPS
jgi:hypothetical protein